MKGQPVFATQGAPLRAQINRLCDAAPKDRVDGIVHAIIVPDSNLLAGGEVAARVYRSLEGQTYQNVIIVAPSHSGSFRRINVCSLDSYGTPFGDVRINPQIRDELCDEDDDIFVGDEGHFHPSGIHVHVPFLQHVLGEFQLVPIVMGVESPDLCRELGHAIGEVMYNQATLVVGCVDIDEGDEAAIARLQTMLEDKDTSALMHLLNSGEVQVPGAGALLVALLAALHRRSRDVRVLNATVPTDKTPGWLGAVISA